MKAAQQDKEQLTHHYGQWSAQLTELKEHQQREERKVAKANLAIKVCVCVCVCVIHHGCLLVTLTALPYRQSEVRAQSLDRTETTAHTTHWNSEATTPQVTF